MKRPFIGLISLLSAFLLMSGNRVYAQKSKRHHRGIWNAEVKLFSGYDDNILKYSDKYLTRFMNRRDSGRFEMRTYDDISVKAGLNISYKKKWLSKRYTRITANVLRQQYAINAFKSWNMYSIYVRQDVTKKSWIQVAYQYIPYFYVRTYRDEDLVSIYGYEPRTFRPFEFAKEHYGISGKNTFFNNLYVRLDGGLHRYFHNSHFTEYDSEKYYAGLRLSYPLTRSTKVYFGYAYAYNQAKGTDEPGENRWTSDDPDGTFREHKGDLKIRFALPGRGKKRQAIEGRGIYTVRNFTTLKSYRDDPTHAGRTDRLVSLSAQYGIQWSKKVKTALVYYYNFRTSHNVGSEYYREFLADEKNYKAHLFGLQLTYKIF